ncbi:hypothetical protein RIF29_21383 [Crotalaria pallida]|uniref:Reverse transcriptase zinc-binding domain-containing protein n=1 Tax=Crotalaria pallida TaxID=3830 RepID=A0AAN9F2X2_CROPI
MLGPLQYHACDHISPIDLYRTLFSYTVMGQWNWGAFDLILTEEARKYLAATKPPVDDEGANMPTWKWSSDGTFSIKSAYFSRTDSVLSHEKILTNAERVKHGIATDSLCPRCNAYPETAMHTFRDCDHVRIFWDRFFDEDNESWCYFYSYGMEDWLLLNLTPGRMKVGSLKWETIFAIAV